MQQVTKTLGHCAGRLARHSIPKEESSWLLLRRRGRYGDRRVLLARFNERRLRQLPNLATSRVVDADSGMIHELSGGAVQLNPRLLVSNHGVDQGRFRGCQLALVLKTSVVVEVPNLNFFCSASSDWRASSAAAFAESTLARFCCTAYWALRTSTVT